MQRDYYNEALEDFNTAAKTLVYPCQRNWLVCQSSAQGMYEQYIRLATLDEMDEWIYPHSFAIDKAKVLSKSCDGLVIYIPFSIVNLANK